MSQLEGRIADILRAEGPLTGAEIWDRLHGEKLALWQTCRSSGKLDLNHIRKMASA